MNEADPETIELRQAESEGRRLNALLEKATADLNAALAEPTPPGADIGQALLARAMEGQPFEVLAMPTPAARVAQLRELVSALANALETHSFKTTELLRRAVNADRGRQMEINKRHLDEGLKALGNTDANVKLPARNNTGNPY